MKATNMITPGIAIVYTIHRAVDVLLSLFFPLESLPLPLLALSFSEPSKEDDEEKPVLPVAEKVVEEEELEDFDVVLFVERFGKGVDTSFEPDDEAAEPLPEVDNEADADVEADAFFDPEVEFVKIPAVVLLSILFT
jgi:hypothetical protein